MANRRKGSAVVEMALMMPWLAFLFVGVLDFGFYSYAVISVENAARVAALYTSSNGSGAVTDTTGACGYVLRELATLPNVTSLSSCNALPVIVSTQSTTVSGSPAAEVSVTYQTMQFIPLPTLTGQFTITRSVWMHQ